MRKLLTAMALTMVMLMTAAGCGERSAPPAAPTPPSAGGAKPETPAVATPVPANDAAGAAGEVKPATNTKCLVMDHEIPADELKNAKLVVYHGQSYRVCCGDCIEAFNKDPEKYVKAH